MAKILVIDDSEFLAKGIANFMTQIGHDVVGIGHDGFEGIQLYRDLKPDLVTLDLTMPNRDGRMCLNDILDHDAEARVMVITALSEKSIILECLNRGAKAFQQKPLKFTNEEFREDFRRTVEAALKK